MIRFSIGGEYLDLPADFSLKFQKTNPLFVFDELSSERSVSFNIPATPKTPPKNVIAKITQNPEIPVESPKIFGPITFPSSCCRKRIKNIKYKASIGLTTNSNKVHGIAPSHGPKNGITFVTPTITLIKIG